MLRKIEISDIWLKAAVLGSLWASSEIILGSFLHNLRIPMAGTLLSALGSAILISGHQLWPQRGLFWRAALICSAMKSISPSAVIIGPMIGIFVEGILLEAGVLVLGRNIFGYAAGGALAVSWSMVQKLISFIITFGLNFIELYKSLYAYAAVNLGISRFGPFDLVLTFFALQMLAGAAVAIVAVRLGHNARKAPAAAPDLRSPARSRYLEINPTQRFSIALLCLNVAAVIAGLWLLSRGPTLLSISFVSFYTVFNILRYRRSLQRLKRPALWLGLAALIMLSGFFLNGLQSSQIWSWNGVLAGAVMTVRAIMVILAFSAISIELRNPRILNVLMRKSMQDFPKAMGIAFEILPQFVAILSRQKPLWKRMDGILPELLRHADGWLTTYSEAKPMTRKIIFLTGRSGQGKTTMVSRVAGRLREMDYAVAGVCAPGYWKDGERSGFDVIRLSDGRGAPLCRKQGAGSDVSVGPFNFFEQGLRFGREALSMKSVKDADFIFVDEVGPLELRGEGWAAALDDLVNRIDIPMLWVVRKGVLREVGIRWLTDHPVILDIQDADIDSIIDTLISLRHGV